MFMHNGAVGNWARVRRKVEALIPDALYPSRVGTTDSEAVFLAILGAGIDRDPVAATLHTLAALTELGRANKETLRFTSAITDGKNLYAFRYAANDAANTLYYRTAEGNLLLVSEPLDTDRDSWIPVPPNHMVLALAGQPVEVAPIDLAVRIAAE
jgi:glutamine amidotransferase